MNLIEEIVVRQRFLPIVDFASVKNPDRFFEVLLKQNIDALQVNFRSQEQMSSLPTIGDWNKKYGNIKIGVGFMYSTADAEKAIKGGAEFVVSSVTAKDILAVANLYQVPAIISGLTPTEIYQAHSTDAELVQIFPASQLHPRSIVSILEHMPGIKLLLTGGLSLFDALEFLRLGAKAVGVKGCIFQKDHLENENYAAINDSIKNFYERVQSV